MEKVIATALQGAETLVDGGIAMAKGLTNPTAALKTTFMRLNAPSIPRSSHTVSVVNGNAYIFGGEIRPREPVDNVMHVINLPSTSSTQADHQTIPAKPAKSGDDVPVARVGHSAAVIGNSILIFGGRGGPAMTALEEHGRVWMFDTNMKTWSFLDPNPQSPYPPSRSYHTSAASQYPLPKSTPNVANVLLDEAPQSTKDLEQPPSPGTYGTFFVHAGCLAKGRASDLWALDISSRSWSPFPSAPDPPRGGTSLVMVRDRLYRFGGFDGNTEQGGQLDFLDVNTKDISSDKGGQEPMALSVRGTWRSNILESPSDKDGVGGNRTYPANRSVLGLAPVTTGQGREYLLIICGEGEASNMGHEGAGRFFDDVWSFQLKPEGNTAASFKDATQQYIMGMSTGEGGCVEVDYQNGEEDPEDVGESASLGRAGSNKPMGGRGWFACSPCGDMGSGNTVLVWGGIDESNERLGDGWMITVE